MILAIPTNDKKGLTSLVAEHFGRCRTYTLINDAGRVVKIIENKGSHMGGIKQPPEIIKESGANALTCRGIGPRAINLCKTLGIKVFVCDAENVQEVFELWKNKKLVAADSESACKEHRK